MKGDWVVLDRYSGLQHNIKKMLLAFASKFLSFIVNSKYSNSVLTMHIASCPTPEKFDRNLKLRKTHQIQTFKTISYNFIFDNNNIYTKSTRTAFLVRGER